MPNPIAEYHDLLTSELAAESQAMLDDQLRRRGLIFGDRPLCTVLRPRFMTLAQYRLLQQRVLVLMRAFRKAYAAAIADAGFRAQFGLEAWEEELIGSDPGFANPSPTSRLDLFVIPQSQVVDADPAACLHGRGFRDDESDATDRACHKVSEVPIGCHPIITRRVHAHR